MPKSRRGRPKAQRPRPAEADRGVHYLMSRGWCRRDAHSLLAVSRGLARARRVTDDDPVLDAIAAAVATEMRREPVRAGVRALMPDEEFADQLLRLARHVDDLLLAVRMRLVAVEILGDVEDAEADLYDDEDDVPEAG